MNTVSLFRLLEGVVGQYDPQTRSVENFLNGVAEFLFLSTL